MFDMQIAGKRWRIDLNARQDVALQLSSVDLPGGAQVANYLLNYVCTCQLALYGLHPRREQRTSAFACMSCG